MAGSGPSDDARSLTDAQGQWRDWPARGYRKLDQPTSMLWLGGVFLAIAIAGLVSLFSLAAHGQLP